jgi:perosamine synthetase
LAAIPYTKPSITDLEISFVADATRNGWGEKCYEYINRFELEFANYVGVKHALSTSSATGALSLGYASMGLKAGDEVILADTNWIATVAPLVHLGVKTVFVDIDPISWCLDSRALIKAVTKKTRAIIVTHLYGNLANMSEILDIGARLGIPIVEDAAEALGSKYQGKLAGSMGNFGVFSFHGTKTLTTGEGGMLVTNDSDLYSKALTLSNHGRELGETRQFWPSRAGYKFKMSNIQAALGCGQLSRVEQLVSRKREIFHNYRRILQAYDSILMNPEEVGNFNSYWMPTLVFDEKSGVKTQELVRLFRDAEIDARVFFWPLSSLTFFKSEPKNKFSWSIPNRAINLPSFYDITDEQQHRVASVVLKAITEAKRQ